MYEFLLNHTPIFYLIQSLWRDEAFSILIAERPLSQMIGTLNFEPPIYYILLHFWVRLFGTSEIAARSLSLFGFVLATVVVIFWAEKIFQKHWLSWVTPILFFLNPMMLYYAFEIRAYGWLMFFSTLSLYAYSTKKYKLLTLANILAFYTHSYAIIIPIIQILHYGIFDYSFKSVMLKKTTQNPFFRSIIIWVIGILPWVFVIVKEMSKDRPTWYYPVDLQLIRSVLGNMFIGYDGTPGGLWIYTAFISVLVLLFIILALTLKKNSTEIKYLCMTVFIPLLGVIGISFIRPLFVNRYLIYVTVAEVLLISYGIFAVKNKLLQKIIACTVLITIVGINFYLPSRKAKLDMRSTIPLIFFEAQYYTPDREHVYLYNPHGNEFPWYVGEAAFSPSRMVTGFPQYPRRAVVVGEDQSIIIGYHMNQSPTILEEKTQAAEQK
jgi:uncharacterized membrane protein